MYGNYDLLDYVLIVTFILIISFRLVASYIVKIVNIDHVYQWKRLGLREHHAGAVK